MSVYAPTISAFSLGSTWVGYRDPDTGDTVYSTPTTGYNDKAYNLSPLPSNAIVTNAVLTTTLGSASTGIDDCYIYYDSTNYNFKSKSLNVTTKIQSVVGANSITFRYKFKANGGSGGLGNHSSSLAFSDNVLTITYHMPASTFTLDKSTLDAGQSITVTITPASSEYKHRTTLKIDDTHTDVHTIAAGTTTYTYSIPMNWCESIPNDVSKTCSALLETMTSSDVVLGSTSSSFTMTVPSSVVPTFTSLTYVGVDQQWGLNVQGKSKATLTINGASGAYGSTISSTGYSISSSEYSSSSSSFTTGYLNTAGTNTFRATITDSRGRKSAQKTCDVSVTAYAPPKILTVVAERCSDASGTLADEGMYCKCTITYSWSAIGSNAIENTDIEYKEISASTYTSGSTSILSSGGNVVLGSGTTFDKEKVYDIRVKITDHYNKTSPFIYGYGKLFSAKYIMDIKPGGTGICVGGAATHDNTFEIHSSWECMYKDQTLDNRFLKIDDYTASSVLSKIITVDGSGSGLDAEKLEGYHYTDFPRFPWSQTTAQTSTTLDMSSYPAGPYKLCMYTSSTSSVDYGEFTIIRGGSTSTNVVVTIFKGSSITTPSFDSANVLTMASTYATKKSLTKMF